MCVHNYESIIQCIHTQIKAPNKEIKQGGKQLEERRRCPTVGGERLSPSLTECFSLLLSLSPHPSSSFLLCLRATNKLWMLIRKGQYSASKINSAARGIKETQTKSADVGSGTVKVTGEPVAGPVKPGMIFFSRSLAFNPCAVAS